MAEQLVLFAVESVARGDGSFVVKPKRLVDGRECGTRQAARMLGVHPETVGVLIAAGELRAWKLESRRGNAKWRIDLGSVLDYKARRCAAAAPGFSPQSGTTPGRARKSEGW